MIYLDDIQNAIACVQEHYLEIFLLEERHLILDQGSSISRRVDHRAFSNRFVQPQTERLFNFKETNTIGHTLIETVHDYEIADLVKKCLSTNHEQTLQLESAGRFLRVIAVPIAPGGPMATLALFQDLTELRNLQTMRRELIGNISHDLRTPIAGIKAMVETLQNGALDDKQAATDFLTRIDDEVNRLTQMVTELTDLSHIETGKAELRRVPTNINILVEEVVAQMNPLAANRPVTIFTDLKRNHPIIKVDRDRIRQTLINIVHNAIKFNKPGGKIIISTVYDTESITVSVSDSGTGISQEDLPHIFERFYKADKARSRGGSGLGLALLNILFKPMVALSQLKAKKARVLFLASIFHFIQILIKIYLKFNKTLTKP